MTITNTITIKGHPLLRLEAFETVFAQPLGDVPSPEWLRDLLRLDAGAPFETDDALRAAIRDLLRQSGYKPTGRGKPASEYLLRAANENTLASINAAVDACNATSLHSGIPISVIDLDRAAPPFRIETARAGQSYVFNAAGQEIEIEGVLCLFDASGPCANAVKDAQRTKTGAATRRTLSVLWGCRAYEDRLRAADEWYRSLLARIDASVEVRGVQLELE